MTNINYFFIEKERDNTKIEFGGFDEKASRLIRFGISFE